MIGFTQATEALLCRAAHALAQEPKLTPYQRVYLRVEIRKAFLAHAKQLRANNCATSARHVETIANQL